MADIFEETTAICGKPKKVSNWLMVETMRLLKEHGMEPEDISFSPANLAKLIGLTEAGTINSSVAIEVFEQVFEIVRKKLFCSVLLHREVFLFYFLLPCLLHSRIAWIYLTIHCNT